MSGNTIDFALKPVGEETAYGFMGSSQTRGNWKSDGLEIPPGTGPYKLVRWVKGDHVEMEKYEDYHLFPLFFDNTYFKVYPDREISILAVQAGECDIAQADWQHIDIAKEDSDLDYSYSRPWSLFLLMFNVENPYLNNKWVRQAISVAFPRQHYSDDVRHGLWDTANQFLSPAR